MKRLFLPLLLSLGLPALVEAKPKKALAAEPLVVINDVVRKLEQNDSVYRVAFKKHAAIYVLRKGAPNENKILLGLNDSQATGKKVRVSAGANSLEIRSIAP